jgi:hypothetical protein
MITIDASGITIPTQAEIAADIGTDLQGTVDPLISVDPDSLDGQDVGIVSSDLRELCEVVQSLVNALDPDKAEDERQDVVCSLTGTRRNIATPSYLKGSRAASATLQAGKTLPAGSLASVFGDPSIIFRTMADVTNSGGSPATLPVDMVCTTTGPVTVNPGTLTVRISSVSGWTAITNTQAAALGANVEGNEDLRIRRESELQASGTSTFEALRGRLLAFQDSSGNQPILDAFIINNTAATPANGLPPKSFEVVIWDGPSMLAQNADVAGVIFGSDPLGIGPVGAIPNTVIDSQGNAQSIPFTRVTIRTISIRVTFNYDAKTYVGDIAHKATLANRLNDPILGQKTAKGVPWSVYSAVSQGVTGVEKIENFELMINGGSFASFTDIAIALREIAQTDPTDITLIGTPA